MCFFVVGRTGHQGCEPPPGRVGSNPRTQTQGLTVVFASVNFGREQSRAWPSRMGTEEQSKAKARANVKSEGTCLHAGGTMAI